MNIILFGPPGAGKGTQAKYLVKKLNAFHISTGEIIRNEINNNTNIGKKIIHDMDEGKFVSDEIVNNLIKESLFDLKKKRVWGIFIYACFLFVLLILAHQYYDFFNISIILCFI